MLIHLADISVLSFYTDDIYNTHSLPSLNYKWSYSPLVQSTKYLCLILTHTVGSFKKFLKSNKKAVFK